MGAHGAQPPLHADGVCKFYTNVAMQQFLNAQRCSDCDMLDELVKSAAASRNRCRFLQLWLNIRGSVPTLDIDGDCSVTTKAAALRWKQDNGCFKSAASVAPVLITVNGNVVDFDAAALARVETEIASALNVDKHLVSVKVHSAGSVVLAITLVDQASADLLVKKVKDKLLTKLAGESIENVQVGGESSSSSSASSSASSRASSASASSTASSSSSVTASSSSG